MQEERNSARIKTYMFATLFALQIDNIDLVRTLHSFHLIQTNKEECNGFQTSAPGFDC